MGIVLINIPLLRRISAEGAYRKQITWDSLIIVAGGLIGAAVNIALFP